MKKENKADSALERPDTRAGLADRERKYEKYARAMEALLQYSPGGIFSYSAETDERFSFISDNMLSFLGYTRLEFELKFENRFSRMVYSEDRARTLREINEQIACGPFDTCEYRIEKKDGSLVWVHDEGHIVADETGKKWFYVVIVDITARVEAQRRERERFQSAIDSLLAANPDTVGALQLNLTQNVCLDGHSASRAARQLMDAKTAAGYFGNIAEQILDPEMRAAFRRRFNRAALLRSYAAGQVSHQMAYSRRNDAGVPIWVRLYLNLLQNPDTGDIEAVAYSVDISREKRRDEILHIITSQEYDLIALLHLEANTAEAYFLGGTLPAAYRALLPAPGATCDIGLFHETALKQWLHPDDVEEYRRCSDPAFYLPRMEKTGHFEFTLRERFPDVPDGEMYRKFQHYYLGSDRGTILVVESDVTRECRLRQRELDKAKAETERVKDIMDCITSGICVLHMPDPDHLSIDYVNRQMYRMLGFEPEEGDAAAIAGSANALVRGYTADAFTGVHPNDLARVKKVFRDNYDSDYFVVDNYRTRGSNGDYYWIKQEVRLREVTPEYRVFYATYHDVSEEVRLQNELKNQLEAEKALRREATAANAAKTDFLSRMSHDIRTPLNGIIGMTYLALEDECSEHTRECLHKIDTSSKFLLGLINDVLDMARAESNRIELHPEPYPVSEFNDYLDAVIRPLCSEKGQRFVLDEAGLVSDCVPLADKLRTNQIIFNLLSNAVKYTPEGGTIRYRLSGERLADGRLAVEHEIADNGIGMSEDFQRVLFDPFSQEGRNDSSATRGSGLGLAIVKQLVDLMGGTIRVSSQIGSGTTFAVRLTFDTVSADTCRPGSAAPKEPERATAALRGRHVLLCEDHPLNQEIIRELLEKRGVSVQIAVNGERGVDLFAHSPIRFYDAILMDIRMPVMDGFAATRAIRALDRPDAAAVPIVAMTADAFTEDVKKCLEAGMNAHLAKPIEPKLLDKTLLGLLSAAG